MRLQPLRDAVLRPAFGGLILALGGCGTISSLDQASRDLDTFELSAVEVVRPAGGGAGRATIHVAEPVASGAIASDRIVIKPDAYRVAFLPDGRWVDPAAVHVQRLMTLSLSRLNRFGLVTASSSGLLPDYSLLTDLEAFQAEIAPEGSPGPIRVVVRLQAAILREADGVIVSSRRFEAETYATGDAVASIVPAFDSAMGAVLQDLTSWASAVSPGRV